MIHRDLKPENIFITNDFKIKIGDFGISRQLNKGSEYAKTKAGTLLYMAQEIIDDEKYNNKVDLWSLGCILYELCTLNYYFYNSSIKKLIDQILYSEYEEHEKINTKIYGEKLENLIKLLLKRYYKTRPDINIFNKLLNGNDSESNQKKIKYLRERYNSIIKNLENISYDYSRKDIRFIRYGFSEDEEPHVIPTCIGFPKDDYSKNSYYLEGEDEDEEKEEEIKEKSIKDIYFIGKEAEILQNDLNLINPIKRGIFFDWDNFTKLLGFIIEKDLKVHPEDHKILITQSPFNTKENREKLSEIILEHFGFAGMYIAMKQ